MSGNYPPPEDDVPGHGGVHGAAPGQGHQPPQYPRPGYPPPRYAPPGYAPPGYAPPEYASPGFAPPGGGIPYARPDFMPPEHLPGPHQPGWGQPGWVQYGWDWGQVPYYGGPQHGVPGWWGEPPDPGIQTNAIFALVASIITLFCCSNVVAIGGVVTSIVALTRWQQQPGSARNLNKWAWISTGGGLVLVVLFYMAAFLVPIIPLLGSVALS